MTDYSVENRSYLPEIASSFSDTHYNCFFETVIKVKPRKIINFGVLEGFSTIAMANAIKANGFGHIYAYDLFEDYIYRSFPMDGFISNLIKYNVENLVAVKKKISMIG